MAKADGAADAEDFQQRNVNPTIPIDGADPVNIAGPYSNVQLEIGDRKRSVATAEATDESTRLRPQQARQEAETGDVVTDSDAIANPVDLADEVGKDAGFRERQDRDEAVGVAGRTATPAKSTPARSKDKA